MRGPGLLLLALFVAATPAWAQPEATPPPAVTTTAIAPANDELARRTDELIRRSDDLAKLRGRGTTFVVIGAVMLAIGVVLAGVSTLLWTAGDSATGYANLGFNSYYQGAVTMDTIGFGLIGGGTTLLAIGAGKVAAGKRPRLYFGAASVGAHF